jgi:hypothetical protein
MMDFAGRVPVASLMRMVHELADDGVVGAGIGDLALQIRALEAELIGIDPCSRTCWRTSREVRRA